jgi:hypothetical protein
MTSNEVRDIVLAEIGDQWDRSNLHGVVLRRCLITPEKVHGVDVEGENGVDVWLVLVENPEERLGYGVVYDGKTAQFGLMQFAEGYSPCLLGLYGADAGMNV